ncbi:MAG TPA: aspartate ammonia-lyase [Kiritimatiellia bacterium]|nr:aspartate ammonia-lyase [Kiritimatiellia bacterium]
MKTRRESDLLGEEDVPEAAYWGIHTLRASGNFRLSDALIPGVLIRALAMVKKACAMTNREVGGLSTEKADAIVCACDEVIAGKLAGQFPLPALQGGAGTSTNMNMNEVLANRALEVLGRPRGDYVFMDPLADVNRHQSTNDVYPTALKVAAILELRGLSERIAGLQQVFQTLEKSFAGIPKIGRTELQDAVPMTLGAEFSAFAEAVARDRWRTFKSEERLRLVNLGGTAVGTGLTAPRRYIFLVIERLRDVTGLGLARGDNMVDQTANMDCFVEVSGMLKACAVNLMKICRDLRLLHYLGEIRLPPCQAGSSIMPGKVNPVVLEVVISAAMKVKANDALIADAASLGTLQINEFLPTIAWALLESIDLLGRSAGAVAEHASHITADEAVCRRRLDGNPAVIAAFLPVIGYEKAEALVGQFRSAARADFREFLNENLGKDLVDRVLEPSRLMSLGYSDDE